MKEAIGLIEKLWAEDRVTFDGTYYSTHDATIYDRPPADQKVPTGLAMPLPAISGAEP